MKHYVMMMYDAGNNPAGYFTFFTRTERFVVFFSNMKTLQDLLVFANEHAKMQRLRIECIQLDAAHTPRLMDKLREENPPIRAIMDTDPIFDRLRRSLV